ncbi:LuxR C-terminal-related transcriptional regulator [Microbacterium alcoholitolerans]|uniref:LuxR C-terminal-related transcriptional regulator n=1 Tax=unclassified Microbacterium TaxID=2609290 RepID=UPI003D176E44
MSNSSLALAERPMVTVPLTWERQMRPALEVIGHHTPRAALVGTAGSGKSTGLQHLHHLFAQHSRDVQFVNDATVDLDDAPAEQVLLVDDLHLLSDEQLHRLGERADDPTASLIIARRPWPAGPTARKITRRLEQHTPATVLGHVSRSDVLDHLSVLELTMADACVEHILRSTLGISWLVTEAVQHHDSRDCAHDESHAELDRSLAELILHRVDTVDDRLRDAIEDVCIAGPGQAHPVPEATEDDWVLQGYSQGLLLRSGDTAPLVRTAVREAMPNQRLIDLCTRFPEALEHREGLRPVRDQRVADALVSSADRMLTAEPTKAGALYDAAVESGTDAAVLAERRAFAAWSSGDLDRAAVFVDEVISTTGGQDRSAVTGVSAAMWSARAMMVRAHEVYRFAPPQDDSALTNASIAALGIGVSEPPASPALAEGIPSAAGVSMELLRSGLRATLSSAGDENALPDLVRSAEMYSSAHRADALCEVPAVLAAIVALDLGRLATAQGVLDDAIAADHGGAWARTRLLLWSAWVAVQRAHPVDARELLDRALAMSPMAALPTRDAVLMHAVRVAIARRYDDASGLEAAWHDARASLLRADVDLYLLHPLAELISAAARAGDAARVEAHLARALQIIDDLGDPPIWSAHVHWAGIQRGILLSRPDLLAPHAKALVAAAHRSRVAARMAKAGRVWTDVLAGTVDPDAVISAAEGLAAIGLMWDAARLAGHGAGRTDDRKVAAQLLACARELHPNDGTRRPTPTTTDDVDSNTQAAPEEVLSDREIEVARLVLQGKTYAEIGETIFISPRTAEHHIAHIRRRLGATSRSEVLTRLRLLLGEGGVGAGRTEEPP